MRMHAYTPESNTALKCGILVPQRYPNIKRDIEEHFCEKTRSKI